MDLALEQTVNADVALRHSQIRSLLERGGWWQEPQEVPLLVTYVKWWQYRILKDHADLQAIVGGITDCLNPFEPKPQNNTHLTCLSSGRACSEHVENGLLNCLHVGEKWSKDFIEGCIKYGTRFASDAITMTIKSKDIKVKEVQATHDLLDRLVYLATTYHLDLSYILQYPLTRIPLMLCDIAGNKHTNSSTNWNPTLKGIWKESY